MNFYSFVLILIATSIASGQTQEFNATNDTSINGSLSIASGQTQECNATNDTCINGSSSTAPGLTQKFNATNDTCINGSSSIAPGLTQKCNATNDTCINDNIHLDFKVLELDDSKQARFGVGKLEDAKLEIYKIAITNKGDIRITDVNVFAEMDKDMNFEGTWYYEANRGRLDVTRDPCEFKKETKTYLKWNIGTLEPEEIKSIILETYIRPQANNTNITVNVTGKKVDTGFTVTACKDKAEVVECDYKDTNTGKSCDKISDTCLVDYCPPWSMDL